MTNILMWLFANDFGLFSNVMKFTVLFFFIIFELIMFMLHRYVKRMLFTLFAICLVFICCFFVTFIYSKISPEYIPQYGTESQKEMLTFCIQEKTENGLTAEDREDIAGTIEYIMKACKKDYDKLEAKHKRELEHKKFLLKNKEILDSLDKMLIEQGVK